MASIFRPPLITRIPGAPPLLPPGGGGPNTLLSVLAGQDSFFSGAGQGPDYDWPNPRRAVRPTEPFAWTPPLNPNLFGQDQFFAAPGEAPRYDWTNPRLQTPAPGLYSWTHSTPLLLLRPTVPPEQPNPILAIRPSAAYEGCRSVTLELIGQDQFFGGAGQVPTYDWQNPRLSVRPSTPYEGSQPINLEILGKDQFFGVAGQGPAYDWPNPGRRTTAFWMYGWASPVQVNFPIPTPGSVFDERIDFLHPNFIMPFGVAIGGT